MLEKLKEYDRSGAYPFHMPGHKRNLTDKTFPYSIDITEIDGFDNLHAPSGCISEIESRAASVYRAKRAFLLVNGATCGILSAVKAMTRRGDKVVIARNCHTSVYHAAELLGLRAEYLLPDVTPPGCFTGIDPSALDRLLDENPDAKLFVMTSPTYEGICSDICTVSEVCRDHGVRLLVDEAHGAHFPFHSEFPGNAAAAGADCSVVSLHKTMPALTQTALLLTNDEGMCQPLQAALSVFQTSSPSYVLMSSIETALSFADSDPGAFDRYVARIRRLEKELSKLRKLSLLFHDKEENKNVFDYDIGKLVISAQKTDLSGIELANILRKKYKLEVEMAADGYIIAMTSVCDTGEGFERLEKALFEIDRECSFSEKENAPQINCLPERGYYPFECDNIPKKKIPLHSAAGKITMEDIFAYPPGIPIAVKGEVLSADMLRLIEQSGRRGVNIISGEHTYPGGVLVADL